MAPFRDLRDRITLEIVSEIPVPIMVSLPKS